jgi:hypothetical protein
MNIFKRIFNAKPTEEELKFQLALGKYVWRNKEEKLDKLKAEIAQLQEKNEALLAQLKQERNFNARLLAERKLNNGKEKSNITIQPTAPNKGR